MLFRPRLLPHLHYLRTLHLTARAMSSNNIWAEPLPKPLSELNFYLCTIPDLADSKRLSIRPEHLERAKSGFELGWMGESPFGALGGS